jgi:hypothetical protein
MTHLQQNCSQPQSLHQEGKGELILINAACCVSSTAGVSGQHRYRCAANRMTTLWGVQ